MAIVSASESADQTARVKTWVGIVSRFVAGQTACNLITSATGFFLMRWLSKPDLAQYSFAFSMQVLLITIADAGFMGSLVGLVGERVNDPTVAGRYIAAVMWFRNRMFLATSIAACILIPFLSRNQPWSPWEKASIVASVIFTSYTRGWSVAFVALVLRKQLDKIYMPQIATGAGRLGLTALLHFFSLLSGGVSIWINAFAGAISIAVSAKEGRQYLDIPRESDPAIRAEVLRYAYPLMFSVIYGAFQPQVSQFFMVYFGKAEGIADLFALGRLGFFFPILASISWFVLEPYCARIPGSELRTKYPKVLLLASLPIAGLVALGYLVPDLFLLLLGHEYTNLRGDIPMAMLTGGMASLAGTLWTLSVSRRWMFWWYTALNVGATLIVQILCIRLLRINTIPGALWLGFYTSVVALIINMGVTFYCLYFMKPAQPSSEGVTTSGNDSRFEKTP